MSAITFMLVGVVSVSLLLGCQQPSLPAPPAPPATPIPMTPSPGWEERAQLDGLVVDFLAAVFTGNWLKARGYLAPHLRARISKLSDLQQMVGIQQGPRTYTISSSELVGNHAVVDAQLHFTDHTKLLRVYLERVGRVWKVTAIDPAQ